MGETIACGLGLTRNNMAVVPKIRTPERNDDNFY